MMNWSFPSSARTFDPLVDLFSDVQRLSDQLLGGSQNGSAEHTPALDVRKDDDGLTVSAELPGVSPDAIEITVEGTRLDLRAEVPPVELAEGETLHRSERRTGSFHRSLELPYRVDTDKVQASYELGVLTVRLEKSAADKPRKVEIRTS